MCVIVWSEVFCSVLDHLDVLFRRYQDSRPRDILPERRTGTIKCLGFVLCASHLLEFDSCRSWIVMRIISHKSQISWSSGRVGLSNTYGCIESTSVVSGGNVIRVRQAPESLWVLNLFLKLFCVCVIQVSCFSLSESSTWFLLPGNDNRETAVLEGLLH